MTFFKYGRWCYSLVINLFCNKMLEAGFQLYDNPDFEISIRLNFTGRDHAGFSFFIQLWRLFFEFSLEDKRHWNYNKNRWYLPGESIVSNEE